MNDDLSDMTNDELTAELNRRQAEARKVLGIAEPKTQAEVDGADMTATLSGLRSGANTNTVPAGKNPYVAAVDAYDASIGAGKKRDDALTDAVSAITAAGRAGDKRVIWQPQTGQFSND